MLRPVVVTGIGVVSAGVVGDGAALRRCLAAPRTLVSDRVVDDGALSAVLDGADIRRTPRVSRLALAAVRLALADARIDDASGAALVLGTEHGDLHSTIEFADGYLRSGPAGLSPLLFPSTVMNAMASAATIAAGIRGPSLTLNAYTVGGELAVARAARTVAAGRVEVALAGGVDERDRLVEATRQDLGADSELRGEGATVLVLEALDHAIARGVSPRGEILGVGWRGLAARPHGVGRGDRSWAIDEALAEARIEPDGVGWVYGSASGDDRRDAWEGALLERALGRRVPVASLAPFLGQHSGLGALRVAAGTWTATSGLLVQSSWGGRPATAETTAAHAATAHDDGDTLHLAVPRGPGLVHGVARGGTHVALVVGAPVDAPGRAA